MNFEICLTTKQILFLITSCRKAELIRYGNNQSLEMNFQFEHKSKR